MENLVLERNLKFGLSLSTITTTLIIMSQKTLSISPPIENNWFANTNSYQVIGIATVITGPKLIFFYFYRWLKRIMTFR